MSSYGRIVDNTVADIITPPPGFVLADCIHASLVSQYTVIPDGVDSGATYNATTQTYTNPDTTAVTTSAADTAAQLAAAKATKLVVINAAAQVALSALATGYPDWEVSTWDQQLREANLVAADNTLANDLAEGATDTIPLIRHMATARSSLGDPVSARIIALSGRIIVNAAAWSVEAGKIIGKRQAMEDAVGKAGSVEDVAAVVVDFA